jgi:hypothetical protein
MSKRIKQIEKMSNEEQKGNFAKPMLADSRSSDFHKWLYTVCEIKASKLKDAHDIFPYIDLTDAKLAFIDGMTEVEYAKQFNIHL